MATQTRETILDASLHFFSKRGYEGVSVQELVIAAGVTKPTLYYYFKSKQGVLSTLLAERFAPVLAELEELNLTGDLETDLQQCAERLFAYASENPEMYRLFLALVFASPDSPQFQEASLHAQRQFQAIEQFFEKATETMAIENDTALYAATFQGALHNYITLFLLGHVQLDQRAAHSVTHRFIHGIGHPGKQV